MQVPPHALHHPQPIPGAHHRIAQQNPGQQTLPHQYMQAPQPATAPTQVTVQDLGEMLAKLIAVVDKGLATHTQTTAVIAEQTERVGSEIRMASSQQDRNATTHNLLLASARRHVQNARTTRATVSRATSPNPLTRVMHDQACSPVGSPFGEPLLRTTTEDSSSAGDTEFHVSDDSHSPREDEPSPTASASPQSTRLPKAPTTEEMLASLAEQIAALQKRL